MKSNSNKSTAAERAFQRLQPVVHSDLPENSMGTESSNTVPPTCITDTTLLRTGIDSLYLTFRGELNDDASDRLIKLKQLAQSERASNASLSQYEIDGHLFEVMGNGRNPYAFILDDANYRIEIAKKGAKLIPMAYCRISSEVLTILGPDKAVQHLTRLISKLGAIEGVPNVSRVDICADFYTQVDLAGIQESEFVTKARSIDRHSVSRNFSGFSFAVRSPLSARLYNKSLEMACKIDRPYLRELWIDSGWDGEQEVWRMEFQFRRQALRELGVVTYHQLTKALSGLWVHSTKIWLKHTEPSSTDLTQTRWPCSPFWVTLQQATWEHTTQKHLSRVKLERGRIPSDNYLFINGLSPLTSYCAREGFQQADEAAIAYVQAARTFHNNRSEETGIDFVNYFRQKIEDKRKAYNTGLNSPLDGGVHPAEKAVMAGLQARARDYRKAKDGE